jgi:hypothetical protein
MECPQSIKTQSILFSMHNLQTSLSSTMSSTLNTVSGFKAFSSLFFANNVSFSGIDDNLPDFFLSSKKILISSSDSQNSSSKEKKF